MAGLDNVESNIPEISADTTGGGALPVKMTSKGPVVSGNTTADNELLKNMEAFLAERNSPMARIQKGLEQAAAWAVPNTEGQKSVALNALATRQNKEAEDIYAQQSNLATMRAALKQQEKFDNDRLPKAPNSEIGGGAAPGAVFYNGIELPPEMKAIYQAPGMTPEKWQKEFNVWAQNTLKERSSASSQTQQDYYDRAGNLLGKFTPAEWAQRKPGVQGAPAATTTTTTAAAPTVGDGTASFEKSVPGLLKREGGYKAVDGNSGAEVNLGINAKYHPKEDIKNMTPERATQIYKTDYWDKIKGIDKLSQQAADIALDAAANQSPEYANRLVSETGGDPQKMLQHRREHYFDIVANNPKQANQLKGWLNRLGEFQPAAQTTKGPVTGTAGTATVTTDSGPNALEQKRIDVAARGKGAEAEAAKTGELYAPMAITVKENGRTAGDRSIMNDKALALLDDPDLKDLVGKFQTGSKGDAFVRQVQAGIEAGNFGSVGMKDLQQNLSKLGASKTQIDKFEQLANIYKQNELDWAKSYLKGSGSVSDNERNLVTAVVGSVTDPIGKLKMVTASMKERADFDKEVSNAYKRFGKNGSFGDFLDSDEYAAIEAQHNNRLAKIVGRDPESLKSNNAFNMNATGPKSNDSENKYKAGEVVGGFKFKGGDWKDKSNWEKSK